MWEEDENTDILYEEPSSNSEFSLRAKSSLSMSIGRQSTNYHCHCHRWNGGGAGRAGARFVPVMTNNGECLFLRFSSRAPALRYALTAFPASSHMDVRDPHYVSGSESDADYGHIHRPLKRPRHTPPTDRARTNGRNAPSSSSPSSSSSALPPLSLSILGVEPIDEFIREVADFIHHTITTRPAELQGDIEVEAKVGILRDKGTGNRLQLPVLVETSTVIVTRH